MMRNKIMDRDTPYSADEQRVAAWLVNRMNNQVGAGDDPIGFVLASYELIQAQLQHTQALVAHCEQFIQDQRIHCAETVYQTDRVIQNAYEFIEGVCDILGYYDDPDLADEE
jgi:GTP-dependent phosphoenolpyruvate carboxykinase